MNNKCLLIIDDEIVMSDLVAECLSEDFDTISKASTLDMARDFLFERQYDCILVDIDVKGNNGAEIIKFIKDYNPSENIETPILVMSGLINDEFEKKFKNKFAGILKKPFKPRDLQSKVLLAVGKINRKKMNSNLDLVSEEEVNLVKDLSDDSLPSDTNKKKVEIVFEEESVEMDVFDPVIVAPFKINDLANNVQNHLKMVQKNSKLADLFKQVNRNDPYMMNHIDLLINITTGISKAMEWGSAQTLEKFIYASYLHDLSLGERSELARFNFKSSFANDEISEDVKKLIRFHPLTSKALIEGRREIPPDVHILIEQHHELGDGSGYPNGLDHKRITPLSSIFITAHLLTDYIIDNKRWNIEEFLSKHKTYIKGPHFRKTFKALEKLK